MPYLIYGTVALAGAWIGSLTTTAVTPQQAANNEVDYTRIALYAAMGLGFVYAYKKVMKA